MHCASQSLHACQYGRVRGGFVGTFAHTHVHPGQQLAFIELYEHLNACFACRTVECLRGMDISLHVRWRAISKRPLSRQTRSAYLKVSHRTRVMFSLVSTCANARTVRPLCAHIAPSHCAAALRHHPPPDMHIHYLYEMCAAHTRAYTDLA